MPEPTAQYGMAEPWELEPPTAATAPAPSLRGAQRPAWRASLLARLGRRSAAGGWLRPRCARCGRRLVYAVLPTVDVAGRPRFCSRRAACRRARQEAYGSHLRLIGASDEALGTALIAADYVRWPLWGRLLPGSWRDQVRRRMAQAIGSAVEYRTRQAEMGGDRS